MGAGSRFWPLWVPHDKGGPCCSFLGPSSPLVVAPQLSPSVSFLATRPLSSFHLKGEECWGVGWGEEQGAFQHVTRLRRPHAAVICHNCAPIDASDEETGENAHPVNSEHSASASLPTWDMGPFVPKITLLTPVDP